VELDGRLKRREGYKKEFEGRRVVAIEM